MNNDLFYGLMKLGVMSSIFFGILGCAFSFIVCLLMRPFWCWYFKIDQTTTLLSEIRDLLAMERSTDIKNHKEQKFNPGGPDNHIGQTEIQKNSEPATKLNAEIEPILDPEKVRPVSKWNVDKPMAESFSNSRWAPPKVKEKSK